MSQKWRYSIRPKLRTCATSLPDPNLELGIVPSAKPSAKDSRFPMSFRPFRENRFENRFRENGAQHQCFQGVELGILTRPSFVRTPMGPSTKTCGTFPICANRAKSSVAPSGSLCSKGSRLSCLNGQRSLTEHKNAPLRGEQRGALKTSGAKGGQCSAGHNKNTRASKPVPRFLTKNALPILRSAGHCELSPPFPPEGQDASSTCRNRFACGPFHRLVTGVLICGRWSFSYLDL